MTDEKSMTYDGTNKLINEAVQVATRKAAWAAIDPQSDAAAWLALWDEVAVVAFDGVVAVQLRAALGIGRS